MPLSSMVLGLAEGQEVEPPNPRRNPQVFTLVEGLRDFLVSRFKKGVVA